MGIADHGKEFRVQVGFSLKIKSQIREILVDIIDGLPEEVLLQHTGWSGKGPETAGAFRAAQVAGGGGFEGNGDG